MSEALEHQTMQRRLMPTKEAERVYGYSHTTLYRDIKAGHIEAVKRGRSTFIVVDSVERRIASLPRVGQKQAA